MSQKLALNKKILFTGGGSGGHISAASAIIEGLSDRYSNAYEQILYIGSNLSMEGESGKSLEEKIIGSTPIPYKSIRGGKLQRYFSKNSFKLLAGVFGGFIDSWKVLREFKPDLIVSTGGYVTVPLCITGWLLRIPVFIHEQTAAVGLTNKTTGRFAKRIYTSFKESEQYFNKKKVLHVGNAIRPQVFKSMKGSDLARELAKMLPEREKLPIVLIMGGGQGSHLINSKVRQMIRYAIEDFQIILQTGDNSQYHDYDFHYKEKMKLPEKLRTRFHPVKFITADEIGFIFSNTDIFVGRSGANTVYEMGVLQIPSIFIPIPWVTHNEQYKNAEILQQLGLAKIIPEGELTSERLFNEMRNMKREISSGKLKIDKEELEKTFPTDAVERILDDLPL